MADATDPQATTAGENAVAFRPFRLLSPQRLLLKGELQAIQEAGPQKLLVTDRLGSYGSAFPAASPVLPSNK